MTVTATDADLPPQLVTFSLAGGADQSKFAITPGGVLIFTSPPDFEAPTDANTDNVYVVMVQATDGAMSSLQTISVTVTPVNDNSPVFTSPANVNVPENTTAITTVTATDADLPAQTVTFAIVGGADQALFSITSGGALSFVSGRDFEMPTDADGNNVYVVTVEASDGNGRTTTQTMNVTVSPANDNAPVITSPDTASVPENTTSVLTVTATDADLPPQTLTFSIVGGADQAKFAITAGGALSFVAPPDFEALTDANGDNVYVVIVQASDGGLTALQAILVTVTNVVEPPLPGDYNGNGTVDAADYVLWRNGGPLQNDTTPASVGPEDYDVWRANFGRTFGSGASLAEVEELAADVASQSGESAVVLTVETAGDSQLPASFVPQPASPRAAAQRTARRETLAAAVSRDDALIAWLALQPAESDGELSDAFDDSTFVAEPSDDSDQPAEALDFAFATL
jgi:hypothetical protein